MSLMNFASWNENTAKYSTAACGTACGASDEKKEEDKTTACGTACGASDDKKEDKPATACGASDQ